MKLRITIHNRAYEVDVEAAEPDLPATPRGYGVESAPLRVPAAPAAAGPAPSQNLDDAKVCRSPVSGIVVRIAAQPGRAFRRATSCWCSRP